MTRTILAVGAATLGLAWLVWVAPASAGGISGDVVRIGIMNDQSGPYADNCGPGSVAAARLAVERSSRRWRHRMPGVRHRRAPARH